MVHRSAGSARLAAGCALLAGGLASLTLAVALGARLGSASSAPLLRIDDLVEAGIVALGLAAAAWLAASCLVGALCVAARGVGTTWRTGERAVQRYAPALVRRALGAGIAASLAVVLASGAGAVAPAGDATPVGAPSEIGVAAELGWVVPDRSGVASPATAADDVRVAESPAPGAGRSSGADDLGWVVSSDDPPASQPSATATAAPAATPAPERPQSSPTRPPRSTEGTPVSGAGATRPAAPAEPSPSGQSSSAVPANPSSSRPTAAPTRARDNATSPASVTVHVGDSLWSIAEAHLADERGASPSDAQVAAAWPSWYAANEEVIGDDPDTIRAGQRLVVPTSAERTGR